MNNIQINGNLVKDPEIQDLSGDWSIIKFTIANNDESKKGADGTWEHITSFFDCDYFTKNPQLWLQKLHKGCGVVVEGSLKQDTWEQDGQKRSRIKIKIKGFPMVLQGKNDTQSSTTTVSKPPIKPASTISKPPLEDIPF